MVKEVFAYLWKNKLWWLLPPVIVIIIFGALIALSASSPVGPFLYMLY